MFSDNLFSNKPATHVMFFFRYYGYIAFFTRVKALRSLINVDHIQNGSNIMNYAYLILKTSYISYMFCALNIPDLPNLEYCILDKAVIYIFLWAQYADIWSRLTNTRYFTLIIHDSCVKFLHYYTLLYTQHSIRNSAKIFNVILINKLIFSIAIF